MPPKSEQVQIVKRVFDTCAPLNIATNRLEREIELLREYRTRLIADVVTGKLDIREATARLPDEAPVETQEVDTNLSDETDTADEEEATA